MDVSAAMIAFSLYYTLMDAPPDEFTKRSILFFYPPERRRSEYRAQYLTLYPDEAIAAYSPLYELRSQIKNFRESDQWFPAMIFAEILVQGLVTQITARLAGVRTTEADFDDFYHTFLSLSPVERIIVRELRNAREHNFGQLLGRVRRDHPHFRVIREYFESFGKTIPDSIGSFKLAFSLSNTFTTTAALSVAISGSALQQDFLLLHAEVNPFLFIEKIERAITALQAELPNNPLYRTHFLNNLTRDNWMRVY